MSVRRRSAPNGARQLRGHAPVFAALGDVTRLALVERLASGGRLSITELSGGARITRQAVTKHLRCWKRPGWSG